jgi:predicted phage baseplate assembly protein
VARGNVLAADQGMWTFGEDLGQVPPMPLGPVTGIGCNCSTLPGAAVVRPRYEPALAGLPLTFALKYDDTAPASTFLATPTTSGVPQVSLLSDDGASWTAVEDLLEENSTFNGFIPEIDTNGIANLRFGDGTYGASPDPGLGFKATYRTGNGSAGNVGHDSLAHVLLNQPAIIRVRNPLAAAGGVDPETPLHIQQYAPFSFQTQLRCVTAADYTAMTDTLPGVEQALGTLRWTGSWYTAFVSVEPVGTWSKTLKKSIKKSLNAMRMMGTDLKVEQADLVGLAIGLTICVAPNYFQGDVYAALWQVLVTGDACAGTPGLLSSENFQFGATVYASPIIAAAQSVPGVVSVQMTTFARQDSLPPQGTPVPVFLLMQPLEIPCCNNDPNNLDLGLLTLTLDGGK